MIPPFTSRQMHSAAGARFADHLDTFRDSVHLQLSVADVNSHSGAA